MTCLAKVGSNHVCPVGSCETCDGGHNILLCPKEVKAEDNARLVAENLILKMNIQKKKLSIKGTVVTMSSWSGRKTQILAHRKVLAKQDPKKETKRQR